MKNIFSKIVIVFGAMMMAVPAFAQDGAAAGGITDQGLKYLAAALAICVSAFAGAIAQGRAASTALDGIARNPSAADKIQTPMILGLALIESLVIYALVISLKLAEFF